MDKYDLKRKREANCEPRTDYTRINTAMWRPKYTEAEVLWEF